MAIKGLTDRNLSFPVIGHIRKGAPKEPNKPGKDLTYFRVEFDDAEVKAAQKFAAAYGDKPTFIRIILPFNEIKRMWDAWLEAYTAGRMVARADGEYYTYQIDTNTGDTIVKNGLDDQGNRRPYIEGEPAGKDYKGRPVFCKPVGRLMVIIPELERAAYMMLHTTSVHDIRNISEQLEAFSRLNGGQIAGIPLILRRRPKEISTPRDGGQRVRTKKSLLSIEADPDWVKKALEQVKQAALPGNGLPLLDSGNLDDFDTEIEPDADEFEDGEYTETGAPPPPEPPPGWEEGRLL